VHFVLLKDDRILGIFRYTYSGVTDVQFAKGSGY
jgi:hypothetical protein